MGTLLLALLIVQTPVPLAGDVESGVLRFAVTDEAGEAIPARLTFRDADGGGAEAALFPNHEAAPAGIAVRKNVVYSLSGAGAIEVPAGTYTVHASRGMEWSLATEVLELAAGTEVEWRPSLVHEVDTPGWASGDFHLHTLTFSGHGDSDLPERIVSLVGEGVEFAVATDHNHHTDYGPTVEELDAGAHFTHVTGNEVSTPIGHLNAFPLDPERPPVDASLTDANVLFSLIRREPNAWGVTPVIQLNHPRWVGIDWFGQLELDPVTATSPLATWSDAFDTLEVLNENAGWGYRDAELRDDQGPSVHSVLEDWYRLLNRGLRPGAVGNSDSHTVHYAFAGYPRNYVQVPDGDPSAIDPAAVAEALRAKRSYTTTGPILEVSVDGAGLGSDVSVGEVGARGGRVTLTVRVRAASWVDVDRVLVIANGDEVARIGVEESRAPLRLEATRQLDLRSDAYLVVIAEGDDPLDPLVDRTSVPRPTVAIANPIWVDADGDGLFTALAQRVRAELARVERAEDLLPTYHSRRPLERAELALAAAESGHPLAQYLTVSALGDRDRRALLGGARAAERLAERTLVPALETAFATAQDGYAKLAVARAMAACGAPQWPRRLAQATAALGDRVGRHGAELADGFPWRTVDAWRVLGPLAGAEQPDLDAAPPPTDDPRWNALPPEALANGRVDLVPVAGSPEDAEGALFYLEATVATPKPGDAPFALGTDDRGRLWANGARIAAIDTYQGAYPPRAFGALPLRRGQNRVVVAVRNGRGATGALLRLVGEDLAWR